MERKLLKIALVVASSLLLSFSAFADEPEASDLPIEEVTHDIELVNDSSLEASEISNDNLAEILGGPLRSPSINPSGEFQFLGFETSEFNSERYNINILFTGNIPSPFNSFIINNNYITNENYFRTVSNNVILTSIQLYDSVNETSGSSVWEGNYNYLNNPNVVINGDGISSIGIASYLSFVGSVFTWLLTTIGTLITFIMGNPFLAVSLFLFLTGTVISFFIRIKNS